MRLLKYKHLHFLCVFVGLSFAQAALAQTPAPRQAVSSDLEQLVQDASRNGKGAKLFVAEYTHTQTITERIADKQGKVKEESETWEAFMPTLKYRKKPTRWVRVKVKENGVALPADKIEKERLKAGERLQAAEEETQKLMAKGTPPPDDTDSVADAKGAYFNLTLQRPFGKLEFNVHTLLAAADFTPQAPVVLAGRETVVLSFKPKANLKLAGTQDYLAQLTGTVWIDRADRIVVRVEGWPLNVADRSGRPAIFYEMERVPGDKWLPRKLALNGMQHKALFGGFNKEVEAVLTDYQRFDAEVKDVKIDAPPVKP